MLTLTFYPIGGGTPAQARAIYFRFCSDGTVRGADNAVAAVCAGNQWLLGQRPYREFQCSGPVWLRLRKEHGEVPVLMGPFAWLKTAGGYLYADDVAVAVDIPGWHYSNTTLSREVSLLSSAPTQAASQ